MQICSRVLDESSLDISYTQPSYEELMTLYSKKKLECQTLYDYIEKQEKDFQQKQFEMRQELLKYSNEAKKIEQEYAEDQKRNLEHYYQQKVSVAHVL